MLLLCLYVYIASLSDNKINWGLVKHKTNLTYGPRDQIFNKAILIYTKIFKEN